MGSWEIEHVGISAQGHRPHGEMERDEGAGWVDPFPPSPAWRGLSLDMHHRSSLWVGAQRQARILGRSDVLITSGCDECL